MSSLFFEVAVLLTTSLGTGGGGASGSSMSFPIQQSVSKGAQRAKRGRIQEPQRVCFLRCEKGVDVQA